MKLLLVRPSDKLQLGSFAVGAGKVAWSQDLRALFAPRVRLTPPAVRLLGTGSTPLFNLLRTVDVTTDEEGSGRGAQAAHVVLWRNLNYVWGDYMLHLRAEATILDAIFLLGPIEVPDLNEVYRYRTEMKAFFARPISP